MPVVISNVLGILFVVVLLVIVGVVLVFTIRFSPARIARDFDNRQKELLRQSIPGEARIVEVIESAESKSWTDVALRLQITPQVGEPFDAITVWAVPAIHLPETQAGKSVPVRIVDVYQSKTKNFKSIFPGGTWAELYYWDTEITEENVKTLL